MSAPKFDTRGLPYREEDVLTKASEALLWNRLNDTPTMFRARLDAYAEAVRSDTLADVAARLPEALIATTPTKDHGQLCPVWVRRTEVLSNAPQSQSKRRGPIVCDCFVRRGAPLAAAAILAHLGGPR